MAWRVVVLSKALFLELPCVKKQVSGALGNSPEKNLWNFKCEILHAGTLHCSSTPKVGEAVADPGPLVPSA